MPNYTSSYTGANVDNAIGKALPLDSFAYYEDKAINSKTYHILWKVKPTASNTVTGIAIDPTTGKYVSVVSINNVVSVYQLLSEYDVASESVLSGATVEDTVLRFNEATVLKSSNN